MTPRPRPDRDKCCLCHKFPATWLVLDPKVHRYIDRKGKAETRNDAYMVCTTCKRQMRAYNQKSRKPRKLQFVRWGDHDDTSNPG